MTVIFSLVLGASIFTHAMVGGNRSVGIGRVRRASMAHAFDNNLRHVA